MCCNEAIGIRQGSRLEVSTILCSQPRQLLKDAVPHCFRVGSFSARCSSSGDWLRCRTNSFDLLKDFPQQFPIHITRLIKVEYAQRRCSFGEKARRCPWVIAWRQRAYLGERH